MHALLGSGMPLPATHLQPVQAIVKMVNAPELSLRGRFAPVAISGRQLRFRRNFSCNSAGCCEIATSACGLLAMTNLGHCTVGGGAQKYATAIGAQPP